MRKATLIVNFIILFFTLQSNTCKKSEYSAAELAFTIDLINDAPFSIGYCASVIVGNTYPHYPDTSLSNSETYHKYVVYDISKVIKPGIYLKRLTWKEYFKALPNDTLSFFIFSTDTLNKYPWSDIVRDYKILKRYDFSLQDMIKIRGQIHYPPTTLMRDIKQFPAYGQ